MTRESGERARMLRFVVGPGDVVAVDVAAKLPGRGIWLSARGDVLETARTKGAFPRAARRPVVVPPGLTTLVETALRRRIVEHIGFARRAGQATAGFAKVGEMLSRGGCGLVLQAIDGSPDERARLVPERDRAAPDEADPASADRDGANRRGRSIRVATVLDAATLGAAFGRDHIVHAAIAAGRLADLLTVECGRLAGVLDRGARPDDATKKTAAGAAATRRAGA